MALRPGLRHELVIVSQREEQHLLRKCDVDFRADRRDAVALFGSAGPAVRRHLLLIVADGAQVHDLCHGLGAKLSAIVDDAEFVDDLCADTLDRLELTLAIEDTFGIAIDDDEAGQIVTVGDLVSLVKRKLR